jgi:hypothetical protein
MTKVINIKDAPNDWKDNPAYVYIGRAGKGLSGYLGNPHPAKGRCSVCNVEHPHNEAAQIFWAEAKQRFERDSKFKQAVLGLRNKVLLCFCKPKLCHGDIYIELLNKET